MSEAVQLAKAARESLSQALNALQSGGAPPELLECAEPIAQAMTVLHRVERSNGTQLEGREVALNGVRAALDRLQRITANHPAVDKAMESVAQSLSRVHALVRYQPPAQQPQQQPQQQYGQSAPTQPSPQQLQQQQQQGQQVNVRGGGTMQMAPEVGAAARAAIAQVQAPQAAYPQQPAQAYPQPQQGAYGPSPQAFPQPQAQPQQPAYNAQPQNPYPQQQAQPPYAQPQQPQQPQMQQPQAQQPAYAQPAQQPQQPYAQPQQPQAPYVQPQQAPSGYGSQPQPQPASRGQQPYPSQQAASPQPVARAATPSPIENAGSPLPSLDVELGTHSASNFYKGLGGNDVIEHGGVFVQTVRVPKIGTTVQLRVLMPGDYEFRATGVVQWTRDGSSEGGAGFGARFTQITPEGRQLVYRYTRNREPMFYDDL